MNFLFSLKGDVSRKEFVSYVLWSILTACVVSIFFSVYFILVVAAVAIYGMNSTISIGLTALVVAFVLFCLLLTISEYIVTAKRLKSINKPGPLVFLGFIGLFIIPLFIGLFSKQ